MEIKRKKIIDEISKWIPSTDGFKTKIEPILINKESDGSFDPIKILNRFTYTIVDQQRDVESVVIPIWNTLLYYNMDHAFLQNSPNAQEFVSAIFQAYGHQQYHTNKQIVLQSKRSASRTDAFIEAHEKRDAEEFLKTIMDNKRDLFELFNILTKYKFVSDKSAAFYLRDIEGIEFDLVPIDSNVARSIQRTGLFFTNYDCEDISLDSIEENIIAIKKRTNPTNFRILSNKIFKISEEANQSPYKLNRWLFLLGADYCQGNKCKICKIAGLCFYNNIQENEKIRFLSNLKS